jgi:hypothetical protein
MKNRLFAALMVSAFLSGTALLSPPAHADEKPGPACLADVPPAPVPVQIAKLCPGLR